LADLVVKFFFYAIFTKIISHVIIVLLSNTSYIRNGLSQKEIGSERDCLKGTIACLAKGVIIPRNPKAELTIGWPAPASEKMLAFA
jgi:hypothetical protein